MGEIKQTNFRIDSDAADRFRAMCEAEGMNQAQGFDHLIQVAELNNAKVAIPERRTEIENVEMHIKAIMDAYLTGLELTKNTEERVREDFKSKLESKDKSIAMLQEKIESFVEQLKESTEKEAAACAAQEDAENRLDQAIKETVAAHEIVEKTQKINDMLNNRMADAEADLKAYKELKKDAASKDAAIAALKDDLQKKNQELSDAIKDNSIELERAAMQHEKAISEANRQIETLQRDVNDAKAFLEREKEQAKADQELAVEKAVRAIKDADQEQIVAMKEEIAALKAKLQFFEKKQTAKKQG